MRKGVGAENRMAMVMVMSIMMMVAMVEMATATNLADAEVAVGFSRAALAAATAVPDWIDAYGFAGPRVNLTIHYTYNNRTFPARLGELLARNATQSRPHVLLHVNSTLPLDGVLLTLLLVDPDAASPANGIVRNYLHWIVSNIPANATASHSSHGEIWEIGVEDVEYRGPAPPFGFHRYYFLVFQQEAKVNITPIASRLKFSVRDFTKTYKLHYPIGGTFFEANADFY